MLVTFAALTCTEALACVHLAVQEVDEVQQPSVRHLGLGFRVTSMPVPVFMLHIQLSQFNG